MIAPGIREEAAFWMARTRDPRFTDWDGLTEWLEIDPAHNLAYEEAFAAHDLAGALPVADTNPAGPSVRPMAPLRPSRRQAWIGLGAIGSVAAAAAAVLLLPLQTDPVAGTAVETPPGRQRLIRLEDGTRIALNGGSRILLFPSIDRRVALERGQATFQVSHDARHPFTVDAGAAKLVDLGTRFDVRRDTRTTEVAVAEGAVLYDPAGAAVRLGPGEVLKRREGSPVVEIARVDPGGVGGWQNGTLVFDGASLARVGDDLGRATGLMVAVDRSLANRTYSGTIRVDHGDRAQLARRLRLLLDVDVASRPDGLYLKAREAH